MNAVVGGIGEESAVRISAACSQGAGRGDKHPMIRVADDAHQKRRHSIVVDDAIETLAVDLDWTSLHFTYFLMEGCFPHKSRAHRIASDLVPFPAKICQDWISCFHQSATY